MQDRFGATNPRAMMLRFHTQTAGSTLTAQQPENNIVRVTLQALAAVLGGTQSLHTNSMDEALWLPTEKSVRIALRTQQIIAEESGAVNVVDPLGGSHLIEQLTGEIEARARTTSSEIDDLRRRPGRHRAGIHPERDPQRRLPPTAGGRSGGGDRRGGERLPDRGETRAGTPAGGPGNRSPSPPTHPSPAPRNATTPKSADCSPAWPNPPAGTRT